MLDDITLQSREYLECGVLKEQYKLRPHLGIIRCRSVVMACLSVVLTAEVC
jgi:hypothetical protein